MRATRKQEALYNDHRNKLANIIFKEAWKQYDTVNEFADACGLAPATVNNIQLCITVRPQARSLDFMATAVGMELHLIPIRARKAGKRKVRA